LLPRELLCPIGTLGGVNGRRFRMDGRYQADLA